MTRCCRGMRDQAKDRLLAKLADLGLSLPDGARILGPTWAWRIVDIHGNDLTPPVRSDIPLSQAADLPLRAVDTGGSWEIVPATGTVGT